MNLNLVRSGVLGLAVCCDNASAIGLGEITLHSRLGQNLRAEIAIIGEAGELSNAACFSLNPSPSADLPVVTGARLRLARHNDGYRLFVTGKQPVAEPILVLGLQAKCGIDLRRDYILMPAPPASHAGLPVAADNLPTHISAPGKDSLQAEAGDTLESLAETLYPDSPARQRHALARLLRANPQLAGDSPLPAGATIRLPRSIRRQAGGDFRLAVGSGNEAEYLAETAESNRSPERRKALPPSSRMTSRTNGDRVILGTGPAETRANEKAVSESGMFKDMEERLLRMESTLHELNHEMGKLHDTIAITTEVLAAKNQLRMAESLQPPAAAASIPPLPAPEPWASISDRNWLELILSMLLGGSVVAGLASFFERRRKSRHVTSSLLVRHREAIPSRAGTANKGEKLAPPPNSLHLPLVAPPGLVSEVAPAKPTAIDFPIPQTPSTAAEARTNENDSVLDLAEIMLSFGRVRGAAEMLAAHIDATAPNNIQPWRMLLDLYQRGDMRDEFETLRRRIREDFNVSLPEWHAGGAAELCAGLKSLEDYAHIVRHLLDSWGKQECLDYLHELVHDSRAGHRDGFPLEVLEEIVLLTHVLADGHGLQSPV